MFIKRIGLFDSAILKRTFRPKHANGALRAFLSVVEASLVAMSAYS